MSPFLVVLIIILSLLVLLFIGLFVIYYMAFYNSKKSKNNYFTVLNREEYKTYINQIKENIDKVKDIPYEIIKIQSIDDKTLVAKYYHVADDAPIDIQCHGYRGNGRRDFSGGLQMSLAKGHNVLLIDHRAQGDSEGHTITFGIKEREDILDWVYYARLKFGNKAKIFLVGISMGAASVLMASELKLPKNVVGIIADCPYSSPRDIISKVIKDMKLPAKVLMPFVKLSALVFGRFNIDECNVIDAVKKSKLPILIIHGKDDTFVPYQMSEKIANANPNIQLELFDDAPHGMSYLIDEEKYKVIVNDFIDKVLGESED